MRPRPSAERCHAAAARAARDPDARRGDSVASRDGRCSSSSPVGGALTNLAAVDDLSRGCGSRRAASRRSARRSAARSSSSEARGRIKGAPGLRIVEGRRGRAHVRRSRSRTCPGGEATQRVGESFRVAEPPFVRRRGLRPLSTLARLRSFYRTYSWVVPLRPASVPSLGDRQLRGRTPLGLSRPCAPRSLFPRPLRARATSSPRRARPGGSAGRRLPLVGGQVAALLLAFAVLAAVGMRRDVDASARRLTWFGGGGGRCSSSRRRRPSPSRSLGAVVGWASRAPSDGVCSRTEAGSPPAAPSSATRRSRARGSRPRRARLPRRPRLIVVLSVPPLSLGGLPFTPLDAAALGALLAIVLASRGGMPTPLARAERRTGTLLLLLPASSLRRRRGRGAPARPGLRLLERAAREEAGSRAPRRFSLARSPGGPPVPSRFSSQASARALRGRLPLDPGRRDLGAGRLRGAGGLHRAGGPLAGRPRRAARRRLRSPATRRSARRHPGHRQDGERRRRGPARPCSACRRTRSARSTAGKDRFSSASRRASSTHRARARPALRGADVPPTPASSPFPTLRGGAVALTAVVLGATASSPDPTWDGDGPGRDA
jgi:hypothetical protein